MGLPKTRMTRLSSILVLVVTWGLQLPLEVADPFLACGRRDEEEGGEITHNDSWGLGWLD